MAEPSAGRPRGRPAGLAWCRAGLLAWGLLVGLGARGSDLLAPQRGDLDASLDRVAGLLDGGRVALSALAAAQAAWVEERCAASRCPVARGVVLIVTTQDAGHDARDLVQSARAELDRAEHIASAETVGPLLDPARRRRLAALSEEVEAVARGWETRAAWYERYQAPWAWRFRWSVSRACAPAGEGT